MLNRYVANKGASLHSILQEQLPEDAGYYRNVMDVTQSCSQGAIFTNLPIQQLRSWRSNFFPSIAIRFAGNDGYFQIARREPLRINDMGEAPAGV
ncbi:MAG: hypothetical protein GY731_16925 [Gammaproteobacteria bacterium]|nr:hypothetical protein [Gammaproteobacteria bacterium]